MVSLMDFILGDVQEIEITILVDKEVAPMLYGDWKLDDILVLHLTDGKDFFVSFFVATTKQGQIL